MLCTLYLEEVKIFTLFWGDLVISRDTAEKLRVGTASLGGDHSGIDSGVPGYLDLNTLGSSLCLSDTPHPEIRSESNEALRITTSHPHLQLRTAGPEEMVSGKPHGGSQQEPAQEDQDRDTHRLSMPSQRGPRSKCLWAPFSKD